MFPLSPQPKGIHTFFCHGTRRSGVSGRAGQARKTEMFRLDWALFPTMTSSYGLDPQENAHEQKFLGAHTHSYISQ